MILTVNITEARARLAELVARAAAGEPFFIARAGKPMVKVVPVDTPEIAAQERIGFAKGL